jgi:uncharacterized membrane protein
MTDDQAQKNAERLAAKRAAVLRPRGRKRKFILPFLAATLVVGVAAMLVTRILPESEAKPVAGAMFGYVPQSGEITYSLADFDGHTARFYQHKAGGGVIVRYFIHKSADGTVSAALDACADCWREARGHRQEGGEVVCSNCDKRFDITGLSDVRDPCVPIPLQATVRGEQVAVAIPELLEAAKYFKQPYGSL